VPRPVFGAYDMGWSGRRGCGRAEVRLRWSAWLEVAAKGNRALQPVDYHLHTRFSIDSDLDPLLLCATAVKEGYGEIGLCEHVDFDPDDRGFGYYDDEAYSRVVEELQARYEGRLTVLKGIEVDFQERYLEAIARFVRRHEFDYVMGSVHYLDGHFIDERGFAARSLEETYRIYERETRALLAAGLFDILGHLDYIRSRGLGMVRPAELDRYTPLMVELAVEAARAELVLEVNVKGDRAAVPTVEAIGAYLEAGGPGVTVGSDSHWLWQFRGGWERARGYLEEAGVTAVALFRDRRFRLEPLCNERGARG